MSVWYPEVVTSSEFFSFAQNTTAQKINLFIRENALQFVRKRFQIQQKWLIQRGQYFYFLLFKFGILYFGLYFSFLLHTLPHWEIDTETDFNENTKWRRRWWTNDWWTHLALTINWTRLMARHRCRCHRSKNKKTRTSCRMCECVSGMRWRRSHCAVTFPLLCFGLRFAACARILRCRMNVRWRKRGTSWRTVRPWNSKNSCTPIW